MSAHCILAIPTRRSGTCSSDTLCVYEVQGKEIFINVNPQLVMLPAIYLKNKVEPDQVPVTLINLSNDPAQLTKHVSVPDLEINQVVAEKCEILPCTLQDVKAVCLLV